MSRTTKRILDVLGLLAVGLAGWVGWIVLGVEAAARMVVWQTPDETVTLSYVRRLFGTTVRASFSVCTTDSGYQVDAQDLHCTSHAAEVQARVPEGPVHLFLSRDHFVIRADPEL